jgi:hypothetical protein
MGEGAGGGGPAGEGAPAAGGATDSGGGGGSKGGARDGEIGMGDNEETLTPTALWVEPRKSPIRL